MKPRPLEYITFPPSRRIERRSGFRSLKIEPEPELVAPKSHSQLLFVHQTWQRGEVATPVELKSRAGTGGREVDVAGGGVRSGSSVLGRARLVLALVTVGVAVRRGSDALRNEQIEGER